MECELAEIVGTQGGRAKLKLKTVTHQEAYLFVSCEEVDEGQKEVVQFQLAGRCLDKKDLFGKSDPFFQVYGSLSDGT